MDGKNGVVAVQLTGEEGGQFESCEILDQAAGDLFRLGLRLGILEFLGEFDHRLKIVAGLRVLPPADDLAAGGLQPLETLAGLVRPVPEARVGHRRLEPGDLRLLAVQIKGNSAVVQA